MLIFADASAPFNTCKAAAGVRQDSLLLATWFIENESHDWIIKAAADAGQWHIVPLLVDRREEWKEGWEDLELCYVLWMAAAAGGLGCVQHLLTAGAWRDSLWSGPLHEFSCQCWPCSFASMWRMGWLATRQRCA
jgi:hypothetical protein